MQRGFFYIMFSIQLLSPVTVFLINYYPELYSYLSDDLSVICLPLHIFCNVSSFTQNKYPSKQSDITPKSKENFLFITLRNIAVFLINRAFSKYSSKIPPSQRHLILCVFNILIKLKVSLFFIRLLTQLLLNILPTDDISAYLYLSYHIKPQTPSTSPH